ncbi:Nucleotide exchange factor SIL1 [Lamellibrachia satsuma]|nr:Nucleotide exchange factor SIL1 [Lamellibrachia satsuma]
MAPLKPHWGLWMLILLVASEQPNAVTKETAQVDDDSSNGALVAVETEDDEETVPGQAIPPGLHVRLNMQTGKREAKLMDNSARKEPTGSSFADYVTHGSPDRVQRMKESIQQAMQELDSDETSAEGKEKTFKYWKQDDKEGIKNLKQKYFSRDELKDALKKFKAKKTDGKENVKRKFRDIEELKKEFSEMNAVMKTDVEILKDLLEKYKQPDLSEDQIRPILTDLEYYLHQIDNAQNFVNLGGLQLIMRDLNHTSEVIRSETALVLGSSVQGNPKVQVAAMEAGAMQQLVRMSSQEPSNSVRSHVLYALSALVRHFPYAQQHFLQLGGLHALKAFFSQSDTAKLRLRAVTLINDMLLEQKAILQQQTSSNPTQQNKIRQYQNVPLLEAVEEQGWCDLVPTLLSLPEHDSREKVLHAMSTLVTLCQHSFAGVQPLLTSLRTEYKNLAVTETDDSDTYFTDMLTLVDTVIKGLIVVKTEL